jgi:hypothetical protein
MTSVGARGIEQHGGMVATVVQAKVQPGLRVTAGVQVRHKVRCPPSIAEEVQFTPVNSVDHGGVKFAVDVVHRIT